MGISKNSYCKMLYLRIMCVCYSSRLCFNGLRTNTQLQMSCIIFSLGKSLAAVAEDAGSSSKAAGRSSKFNMKLIVDSKVHVQQV